LSEWIDVVLAEAERQWKLGQVLHLSKIPALLKRNSLDTETCLAGRSMSRAVALDGVEKLKLLKSPDDPKVLGVVPGSVALPSDLRGLFSSSSPASKPIPRFVRGFWAAFIRTLSPGARRFILVDDGMFVDLSDDHSAPPGGFEVTSADIIHPSEDGAPADVNAVSFPRSSDERAIPRGR
jgi:hypothetical protein